jgi:hypothetical protein
MKDIPRQRIKYIHVRMVTGCTIEVLTASEYRAVTSPEHTESVISYGVNSDVCFDELLGDTLIPVFHEVIDGERTLEIDLRRNEHGMKLNYKPKRFVIRAPTDCYLIFDYK